MMWLALTALLALFVGAHLVPFVPSARTRLVAAAGGERRYQGLYTIASVVGLFGAFSLASAAPVAPLWVPSPALRWVTLALTLAGFVLLGAAYVGGEGRRFARHPMLAGIALWSAGHLPVNGDPGHLLVFATLAGYALAAMLLSDRRDKARDPESFAELAATTSLVPFTRLGTGPLPWRGSLAGLLVWLMFLVLHPWLFGASALP